MADRVARNNDKIYSAQLAAEVTAGERTGWTARTILRYYDECVDNDGAFVRSLRGCHPKAQWLLDDVKKQQQAIQWVRENAAKKGFKRMTCKSFRDYLNTELLKDALLDRAKGAGGKRLPKDGIHEWTTGRYLHRLGFEMTYSKKGAYFDGHERPDVVADRVRYLAEKKEHDRLTVRSMPSKEEIAEYMNRPFEERHYVEIVHDESACTANDAHNAQWGEKKRPGSIKRKSPGAGLMISAFISEIQGGVLTLPNHRRACKIMEYGKGEWWNSEKMLAHLEDAIDIAEKLFPWARLIFRFDHSSNHTARGPDALNANNMNANPGAPRGKQNIMRDTKWVDDNNATHKQSMVFTKISNKGKPKGLRQVLRERGLLDDDGMPTARALRYLDPGSEAEESGEEAEVQTERNQKLRAGDMHKLMAAQPDFVNEKTLIHKMVEAKGHICRFYPKFQ
jgi:hypothetical protein